MATEQEKTTISCILSKEQTGSIFAWYIRNIQQFIPQEIQQICLMYLSIYVDVEKMTMLSERNFFKKYWIEAGRIGRSGNGIYESNLRIRRVMRKEDRKNFALYMAKTKRNKNVTKSAMTCFDLLQKFKDCRNIINLFDVTQTRARGHYFILELGSHLGCLISHVVDEKMYSKLNEFVIMTIIKQIASGLAYIHSEKYVHGNLNPYTIRNCNGVIKIGGFSSCSYCDDDKISYLPHKALIKYSSPEIVQIACNLNNDNNDNNDNISGYNMSTDIWSLGVIMFLLLSGYLPFDIHHDNEKLFNLIISGKYEFMQDSNWSNISHLGKDLIQKMLIVNHDQKGQKKRIDAAKILQHSWINIKEEHCNNFDINHRMHLSKFQGAKIYSFDALQFNEN